MKTTILVLVFAALGNAPVFAGAVFSENFDAGSATFTGDTYWIDNSQCNGIILQNTATVCGAGFTSQINSDVSGPGYFLFDGTAGAGAPDGENQIYISPTFAVDSDTDYTVSFYLTSANGINSPSVQPELGGTLLGSPVTPVGTWAGNGWQQFSFTWSSGANTSASVTLLNFVATSEGNDFGVDNILVTPVLPGAPEPGTMALLGVALAGVGLGRRRLLHNRH